MKDWIKCRERLPEPLQMVQVFGIGWQQATTLYYLGDNKFTNKINYDPNYSTDLEVMENYLIDNEIDIYNTDIIVYWAPLLDAPDINDDFYFKLKTEEDNKKLAFEAELMELLEKYGVTLKIDRAFAGKGKSIIANFKFSGIDLGREIKNENN